MTLMTDRARINPHIGIVAGTAEGAALCYRTLCHEGGGAKSVYAHPEITLHTFPLHDYLTLIEREDWAGVAALMSRSAALLARSGADLIICPNNTLHRAFHLLESPVPWLHIADAVAGEINRRTFRRVALLGTQLVMQGNVYQPTLARDGLDLVLPEPHERIRIDDIIRTELIRGHYTAHSRAYVQGIISQMAAGGADAVILGCTELPLLLSDEQAALPLLDSTRLLARAALQRIPRTALERPLEADTTPTSVLTFIES
jgi:aspartate racemase